VTSSAKTTCWRLVDRLVTRCDIFAFVAVLFQQLVNRMCSHCLFPSLLTSCLRLVDNLLQGCWTQTDLWHVVPTTCYRPAIQQVVCDNFVITGWSNSIVTACWQACYKPVAFTSCWQVVRFLRGVQHHWVHFSNYYMKYEENTSIFWKLFKSKWRLWAVYEYLLPNL
jgi:hypothetical protein